MHWSHIFLAPNHWCKKDITPLLTHWSYIFLALTHRYSGGYEKWKNESPTSMPPEYLHIRHPPGTAEEDFFLIQTNDITLTCRLTMGWGYITDMGRTAGGKGIYHVWYLENCTCAIYRFYLISCLIINRYTGRQYNTIMFYILSTKFVVDFYYSNLQNDCKNTTNT